MFGIEDKYLQFEDLNKLLLKPTIKELNQKSNLRWS
ncbi:RepB family plasmid replication initiator protein [Photorhabdus noenieputensis]|nr:RepB family plasmid replication initiator protein [Photorhabdus noenieputensis]